MPITNIENCTQLEFGTGDIQVGPGLLKLNEVVGAVIFEERDPSEVGTHVDHPGREIQLKETRVRMTFTKIESIDVVIKALEKTKKYMITGTTESDTQKANNISDDKCFSCENPDECEVCQ